MREKIRQAIALSRAGRQHEAVELLRMCLEAEPQNTDALRWLAALTPDQAEGQAAVARLLTLHPDDTWALAAARHIGYSTPAPSTALASPTRLSALALAGALGLLLGLLVVMGFAQIASISGTARIGPTPSSSPRSDEETPDPPTPTRQVLAAESRSETMGALNMPPVKTTTSVEYYDVSGTSESALRDELYTSGPFFSEHGEHAIASATYRIWMNWQQGQALDSCIIDDVEVSLDITYTYPRWSDYDTASPALQAEWDRFLAYVVRHEEHHGAIALGCAQDLAEEIWLMPDPTSCDNVYQTFNARIDAINETCDETQRAFDEVDGRVSFPLPANVDPALLEGPPM